MSPEDLYAQAYSLHHKQHDLRGAMTGYEALLRDHNDTNWASWAREQIAVLEADPAYQERPEVTLAKRLALEDRLRDRQAFEEQLRLRTYTLAQLLASHVGQEVGINALDPEKIVAAKLADVQADYFSVLVTGLNVSIPFSQVIRVVKADQGAVKVGAILGAQYGLLIRVYDFVVYKGSIGVSMPLSNSN